MSMLGSIRCVLGSVGHWIQETYCSVGQKVAERLEAISDRIAEKRYRGEHAAPVPTSQVIEIKGYQIINGHKQAS
jgi:hypothetical protein